jgi:nucleolar complex protein 2
LLLSSALKNIPEVIQHHVPIKESHTGKLRLLDDSKKFASVNPLIKSYGASVHSLLDNLSDPATINLTLASIRSVLPYLLTFKKLLKGLTKSVVEIWSDAANKEATRIAAFLVLRRLMVISDASIKENVLKQTYQGLVKGSRNTTVHTIQGVNLMKNSAAELWTLDTNIGYTTGFNMIRQLAIHLRSSINTKSKESYKAIYNWQYVHSLDFWSRVVALSCNSLTEAETGKSSLLRPLIYPLVQVSLGAARIIPTSQYFPLRFQVIRSLLRISLATRTYIPLASTIYEVLTSAEMKKPPKPSTLKPLDFDTTIRATAAYLRTRVYQDGVGEQVTELLSEFLVQWCRSAAFPELALPVTVMLKRWLKEVGSKSSGNKNNKVNSMIALLVQKIEANSRWIEEKRAKIEFAPNDRAGVEGFLKDFDWTKTPLGAYVANQQKARAEKARLLEEARKERERERREDREEQARQKAEAFESSDEEE